MATTRTDPVAGLGLDNPVLDAVFNSLEAGLCVIELIYDGDHPADYRFLATNASFERHSGLVGVRGKRVHEVIPNFESHWFAAYEKVARTGEPVRIAQEASGLNRWFEVSASRLGGAGSRTLVILFEDITSRRKADQALKDAQDRLAATMAAGEIATWTWNVQHDTVIADENLARIFGVSEADAAGGPISAYVSRIHPEDRARVQTLIGTALARGQRYEAEYRIVREDDTRWVIARGNVELDAEGQPLRLPGVVLDVTTQKGAEHALRLSEARLQMALEAGNMGTWEIDLTTDTLQCSASCKANYGRRQDERFTYDDLCASALEADRAGWESAIAAARSRAEGFEVEYRVVWPDASIHWVYLRGTASTAQGTGDLMTLSGVSMLVDEEKRVEESLRAADRQKDEFLATASHELRTPLNAILGWSRLLRGGKLDAEGRARGLETIERNAIAQVQVIEDILDGSRIISGKLHLEIRPVDLAALVAAAVDVVRPAAEAKQIALTVSIDARAATVSGDPDRLQQVVWNLVNNAIKFTPKGGHVVVTLAREGSGLELIVADSGQGIPASFLPFVFDRFRQVEGSTTRRHGGLGLGLTLVKHLVEAHGGTVHAESAGEDLGATFVVRLPVRSVSLVELDLSLVPPIVAGDVPGEEALAGVVVLVVDDEADARDLVATVLHAHGAEVAMAASADNALALLGARWPTVLVSDIGMPNIDGYELIRRLRAGFGPRGAALPAVALTAYSREEDRRRAHAAGFNTYLSKPVDPTQLVQVIAAIVAAQARA